MQLRARTYTLFDLLRIPFRTAPLPMTYLAASMLARSAVPSLQVLAVAAFIDTALAVAGGRAALPAVYAPALAVAALVGFSWIPDQLNRLAISRAELKLYAGLRSAFIAKRARMMYRHIENPETWDLISRVSDKPEQKIGEGVNDLFGLASTLLTVGGLLAILFARVWWAAIAIIGISVPLLALSARAGRAGYDAEKETARMKRGTRYLATVLKDRENVEERSLFGYTDHMDERWHAEYERARKIELRVNARWFVRMKGSGILVALLSVAVAGVLLAPVVNGRLSLGLYFAIVNAVFGLVQSISWNLVNQTKQLSKSREYLRDLTTFAALEETPDALELPGPPPAFRSLEFRDVTFAYPGTERRILDGLSFSAEAGRHYALVGVNGAGKTTVTKLLTGLYPEYGGEILLDGRELRTYTEPERKAYFSVVFQDFARYGVPLHDNIAVGGAHRTGEERLREVLHDAGLEGTERRLPQGWDTPLGKIRTDGQDLSGGEWQRVAMARAMAGPAPVRILDEPTASLDPISESRIYEEYGRMSAGRTTFFISHRLGSATLADEILVIDAGRLAERGSHAELMERGGLYAEMFESQRSWYQ
ncbi:MAG: ABC transporter ATP-binding protein [Clostridia bacterium]|nr:ABC transporter ATP-binding protein [Clostridia bacterium]